VIQQNGDDDRVRDPAWEKFFDRTIVALAPVVAKTVSDARAFSSFDTYAQEVAGRTVRLAEEILMHRDASVQAMVEIDEDFA